MLNLSDIRKKARKGKKGKPAAEGEIVPDQGLETPVENTEGDEEVLVEGELLDESELTVEELEELRALEEAVAAEEKAELEDESGSQLSADLLNELQALEETSMVPAADEVASTVASTDQTTSKPDELPHAPGERQRPAAETFLSAEELSGLELTESVLKQQPVQQQPPTVEEKVSEKSEPQHYDDPLEALFNFRGDVDFATEEDYFQGLVGESLKVDDDLRQMLSFSLGDEEYMIDICDVREIIKMREVTDIPRAPYFILGIISLRGSIIPVFDLKKRLKLGSVEESPDVRIVVCQKGELTVGLMVERINQVVRLPLKNIESTPAILSGLDRDLVEGVGRHQGKMMILLDLPSVMDAELF